MKAILEKTYMIGLVIFLSVLFCSQLQAQQIVLNNLPKTCLPEFGRMMSDRTQKCHCPPEEMCNQTINWKGKIRKKLPLFIFNICCRSEPDNLKASSNNNECDVHYFQTSLSNCPGETRITGRTARFCGQYSTTNASETANITALNTCLTNNCQPIHTSILSSGGSYNRGENHARAFKRMKDELVNQLALKDYLSCRSQCFSSQGLSSLYSQSERDIARWSNLNLSNNLTDLEIGTPIEQKRRHEVIIDVSQLNEKLFYTRFFTTINQTNFSLFWNNTYPANRLGHPFAPLSRISYQDRNLEKELIDSQLSRKKIFKDFLSNNGFKNLDIVVRQPTPPFVSGSITPSIRCSEYQDVNACISTFSNDTSCLSCLSPYSKITMANSSEKEIKDLNVGDKILSSYNKHAKVTKVIRKEWSELVLYSINKGELEITADHPIMTKNGWRAVNYVKDDQEAYKRYGINEVASLKVGDFIQKENDFIEVKSIVAKTVVKDGITYNLQLEKPHNSFYANGILVKSHR